MLPISAILPCRNNRKELEDHVGTMLDWCSSVAQIIVVDSSTDGSLDFLKAKLTGKNVQFHSFPPGLYQAWNFGVSLAQSDFCYFSTVGDAISMEGLEHLFTIACKYDLEAVISPPQMVDLSGKCISARWPIHELVESLTNDLYFLDRSDAVRWLTAYLPLTILGSSAANIYKTNLLKNNPFPTNFGHCGDTAFGVQISPFVKMAVTKKICSRFVTHGQGRDITAREQFEVAKKFLPLLESTTMPAEAKSSAAMSRALLKHKIDLFEWLAGLEPLAAVVKEQKGYIDILEGQNATLREEHESLSRLAAGIPLPFVKAGHLLSLKRFLKRKLRL
jgi:hypothetical protein